VSSGLSARSPLTPTQDKTQGISQTLRDRLAVLPLALQAAPVRHSTTATVSLSLCGHHLPLRATSPGRPPRQTVRRRPPRMLRFLQRRRARLERPHGASPLVPVEQGSGELTRAPRQASRPRGAPGACGAPLSFQGDLASVQGSARHPMRLAGAPATVPPGHRRRAVRPQRTRPVLLGIRAPRAVAAPARDPRATEAARVLDGGNVREKAPPPSDDLSAGSAGHARGALQRDPRRAKRQLGGNAAPVKVLRSLAELR
jgi:hypothetical protein